MDRKAWIAVTLSVLGLISWTWYSSKTYKPRPAAPAVQQTAQTAASPGSTPGVPVMTPSMPGMPATTMVARSESLKDKDAEYVFNNDAGGIERVSLLAHDAEDGKVTLNRDRVLPIGALGLQPGEVLNGFEMVTNSAKGEVVFTKTLPDGLEIKKTFTLPAGDPKASSHLMNLEVAFHNNGTAVKKMPQYYVSAGGAAPIHIKDMPIYTRFDWYHGSKHEYIDVNWFSASMIPIINIQIRAPRTLYLENKPDVAWAAVTSQYFCTILTLKDLKGSSVWARRFDTKKQNDTPVFGIQGAMGISEFSIPAGQTVSQNFQIYTGPKDLNRLRELKGGQEAVMNFGMFGFVSEQLLWAMNYLNSIFHSYALAIIALTLLIKSALWPIQNKATREMRKMSALSPKMTEMREKFKDDPQKMNEETMKLYKEYGVNPFSGCLPMLIQIPIFFGFYAMLGSAYELRNSSFLWVTDLSQPDTLFRIPGINFPINLLPIVMAGTMVWQMIISPKSGDAMQQRMFYFMPVIFLVFCYNYASGLALYWTTQNLFSIVQLYMTRNTPLPTLEKKSVIAKREAAELKKKQKKRSAS